MTRRRRVEWLESARRELHRIVDDLSELSPQGALGTLERIEDAANSLDALSERGRLIPELAPFPNRNYRELQVPPYRLLYRVDTDKVIVLGVFDGRRDLDDVILERLFRFLHGDA